uniref:OTU domain-containing protein n=1 Tax=Guillardia theta TaxID=55529 RepID=A0A7S4PQM5_GUITH|mmetsp:Transcript_8819/g.29481  ORF Transcript_8819/g.29481 Transcript_8819/m.29481 type:complete len:324 (+) Transcript_8819:111-1082(+)
MAGKKDKEQNKKNKKGEKDASSKKKKSSSDLCTQRQKLKELGLRIKIIEGDGNCLFRAIADQLHGDESLHHREREKTVNYMEDHKDQFACFMDESESFEDYCSRMRENGEWGGNMEIVANASCNQMSIAIHQADMPCFIVSPLSDKQACVKRTLHISLHDGNCEAWAHYNSVRREDDQEEGAIPKPINLTSMGDGSQKALSGEKPDRAEQQVMRGTGVNDVAFVRKVLGEVDGDEDAAIEYIISTGREERKESEGDAEETLLSNLKEGTDKEGEDKGKPSAKTRKEAKEAKKAAKRLSKLIKKGKEEENSVQELHTGFQVLAI